MTNTYRATTEAARAVFFSGVFEHEFTPSGEQDALAAGLVEIVPRTYLVLSDNYAVPQGETFEAALLIENEAALIAGGHLERVDKPPTKKPKD